MNARTDFETPQITCRISQARELGGCLAVTVPRSELLRLRKAIFKCGAGDAGIVRATVLACGTKVRLLIVTRPDKFAALRDAIQRAFASASSDQHQLREAA